MAQILRAISRQSCLVQRQALAMKNSAPMATSAYKDMQEYWDRNKQRQRPISPHLSVYRLGLTGNLSFVHRMTGIGMAVAITAVSSSLLFMPGDYATYLGMVKDLNLSPLAITGIKLTIAWPMVYHYLNGIRHLSWDACFGYDMPTTYRSGYLVMASSAIVSLVFACML